MIQSEQELITTQAQIEKFKRALVEFDLQPSAHPNVHPKLIQAQREAVASQLESLQREIKEYKQQRKDPTCNG